MRKPALAILLASLGLGVGAGPVLAQAPIKDSVIGSGHVLATDFDISVESGPSGEDVSGSLSTTGFVSGNAIPTCLHVVGNVAVAAFVFVDGPRSNNWFISEVVDNGPPSNGQPVDTTTYNGYLPGPRYTCPAPDSGPPADLEDVGAGPFTSGDVIVTDAEGPHVRCGDVITEDTTLTSDLNCYAQDSGGVALTIGAPGVTLDLGGHNLRVYEGVVNEGHDDVTIRNGTFQAEHNAIRLEGVTGNTVRDIGVRGVIHGIVLDDSDHNRVLRNRLESMALELRGGSDHNLVRGNLLTQYEGSMILSESSDNRVVDNIVWTTDSGAIGLGLSHRNKIHRNTFVMEYDAAMRMSGSNDNDVFDNLFVQHGTYRDAGVRMANSSRNLFRRNEFTGGPVGIFIGSGADNVFRRNTLTGAPRTQWPNREPDGISVDAAATGTLLQANSVEDFVDDGIQVAAPGTALRSNTANDNGDLGIEAVPGVTDLGGNSASGNGNALQCVNVFCD